MRTRSRVAPFALAAVVLGSGLGWATTAAADPGSAAPAVALSCYGSAKSYTTDSVGFWPTGSGFAYTTSNCADINVKPTTTRRVRVCWKTSGTCNAYRNAPAGQWTVAASDVLDGSGYWLDFEGSGVSRGQVAA
ncbi:MULTISPECIES: hypothetical protein [unclassified Streptomyces]|uniref:hypothetical protein n=1 Tax=unclassified Streptomyces TaxID=2593676 RepID=UPI000DC5BAE9|nr:MULTISPECIES: hypothetical protein [unclassified Streptomyces]RAJ72665.1 hypothetical protein K377_07219 [Streptomyces sp. PsTaAH-137]